MGIIRWYRGRNFFFFSPLSRLPALGTGSGRFFQQGGLCSDEQYVWTPLPTGSLRETLAAVCLPETWPDGQQMLSIARENRLPETAFAVREGADWHLRWFAPSGEVSLCGHATLAAAYAICRFVEPEAETLHFQTLSGPLTVRRRGELFELDLFPPTPSSSWRSPTRSLTPWGPAPGRSGGHGTWCASLTTRAR